MSWNIQFQFSALLLALVIASMCLGQKRLHLAAERAFVRLLFCVIICILMDIISVFAMGYAHVIGKSARDVISKLYLLSIVNVGCQAAWFAVAEIGHSFEKKWAWLSTIPVVVEAVVLVSFPTQVHIKNGSLYITGIPVLATYILCAAYIASISLTVAILRKHINQKKRVAIYFGLLCWAAVAAIQFVNNELLVVSFALALSCTYLYCKLENPEYHLDFATNAFNVSGFSLLMNEYLKTGEDRALVSVSVGDMNMVNEMFGSIVAEKLLVSIADFCDGIPNTSVFRLEDNMFCILADSSDEGNKAIEQVIRRFSSPWIIAGIELEISVSLASLESILNFKDSETLLELIHYFALESKKLPQGQVLYINDNELLQRQRSITVQHSLEWALKNNGVEVFYQPIYDIKAGRISSLEALVRIRDENDNLIMPGDFIETAERNGMIVKLGEAIFRKTCEFIQRSHIADYGVEYIEVNLSAVQCMQEDLAQRLMNIMGEYQIPPYRINFEITETAAANFKKTMDKNMKKLIDYGAGFSLDDYGTGYSNISYLVELPLKIVKIDKLMADSYFSSEKVKLATEYSIEMIHKLGMHIVVEGIETEEQYQAFKALGVEYIQGYYFSKPLPKNKVVEFIQKWL